VRRWTVRMVIETNENPDKEIYYDDQEIPRVLRQFMDAALEDRDDGPQIVWSEWTKT
jgi:hypothetical protein